MANSLPTPLFEKINLMVDGEARSGAENMAIDELLMERVGDIPILRIYGWSEPTVSFGYFLKYEAARVAFDEEGLHYMRRMTGGGIVDHRDDVTYTLVIPRSHSLAVQKGAKSYEMIHQVIADALVSRNEAAAFYSNQGAAGGDTCFSNPVCYDLMDAAGAKVAGAGQRRTRYGLLHQGSVRTKLSEAEFAEAVSSQMAKKTESFSIADSYLTDSESLAQSKYATEKWLTKK